MVRWTDIKSEYQTLETGFRERIVRLFEKYAGEDTDEKIRGKVVTVTVASFARHMGIPGRTFANWVDDFGIANMATPDLATCVNDGVPPRESFLLQAKKLIEEVKPYLPLLGAETHPLILEDIAAVRAVLDEIEAMVLGARTDG